MSPIRDRLRIAAIADLHFDREAGPLLSPVLAAAAAEADVLLLGGDLTHHGTREEAQVLVRELATIRIPVLAVLGNHDHQSGEPAELTRILSDAGIRVLDGDIFELDGVGFAGVKGFAGGFGARILESWGEDMIKRFVHEAVEEALKLESALSRLGDGPRVVLTHYAPIRGTVEGEPEEILPFLGCSRLEEPLNRYGVLAAFHGHAHHGRPEGRTSAGVPVYNVSLTLMRREMPEGRPFRLLELPLAPA